MLLGMARSWLRRTLTSILGVVFAVSMSVSVVHATEMAVKMTMASAMAVAAGHDRCADCDHGNGTTKATECRLAVCAGPSVATLSSTLVVVARPDALDKPTLAQPSLVGWAHPPDPYPPRLRTLG